MPWTINNIDAKTWILNFIFGLRFIKSSTRPIKAINNEVKKMSEATHSTIRYFLFETDPEVCDFEGDNKLFFEYLFDLKDAVSSIENLKEYLDWRIEQDLEIFLDDDGSLLDEEPEEDEIREWPIGPKSYFPYSTIDQFKKDVDCNVVCAITNFAWHKFKKEDFNFM